VQLQTSVQVVAARTGKRKEASCGYGGVEVKQSYRQRRRAVCCLDFVLGGEQWFVCCGGETGGAAEVSVVELEEEVLVEVW
jgi:hypothetical protein